MDKWRTYKTSQLIHDGVLEIGDGYRAKNSEMSNVGLPFIRAGDVNGGVNTKGCDLLGIDSVTRVGNKRSYIGDVILTTKGTVGRLGFVSASTDEFVYSPQLCFWRSLKPDFIDPRFIYFALQSKELKHQIEWSAGQTDMAPYISLTDQRTSFSISFPEIEEQRAITSILSSLDDKIDLNRRMNETLEAMARAIFKDWFVDFGPVRAKAESRPPYLSPEIWALFPDALDDEDKPVGWNIESVYDQATWINGAAYKDMHFSSEPDALPVVKIAELKNGITKTTRFSNTDLGERYKIRDGELLFSWSGNPDTSIDTFIWVFGDAWLNQHIFSVRTKGRRSQVFLYTMLKFLRNQFAEIARNKQTTGLGHVTQQDLMRLEIITPSKNIQIAFDNTVGQIHARYISNLIENKILVEIRDCLLPKLMSGEIRLRDAEKIIGESL